MRQEARLAMDDARGFGEVRQRCWMSEALELFARSPIAQLRLVAEREQRFLASGRSPGFGDCDHRIDGQIGLYARSGSVREGAIVTDIPAQLRQRNEHFPGIGNAVAMGLIASPRGDHSMADSEVG